MQQIHCIDPFPVMFIKNQSVQITANVFIILLIFYAYVFIGIIMLNVLFLYTLKNMLVSKQSDFDLGSYVNILFWNRIINGLVRSMTFLLLLKFFLQTSIKTMCWYGKKQAKTFSQKLGRGNMSMHKPDYLENSLM